ncbi:universal stress protein [uncultured Nostoc sp.]|uniref:universal stress protein n=1 Tax=uncultured Nostoc sp. TaxID=340711 RepID=UPI0035C9665D
MFSKILVAIDRFANGNAVFDAALALAKATKGSLILLHILSLLNRMRKNGNNCQMYIAMML